MIQLNDISKIYNINGEPFYALNKVSLQIEKGEMVAVRGRSGAGKSTLLHIMGCLDTYDHGSYVIDSMNTAHASSSDLAHIRNEKIGFVLQDFSLINHRTALYNVKAPMLFNKTPFREMNGNAIKALTDLGIAEQAGKRMENMSGGQRQRVAIARAMVNDPPIILADEPTGNLDSVTAAEIMDIFKELNKRGKTVVIVTHDEALADRADRAYRMIDGEMYVRR